MKSYIDRKWELQAINAWHEVLEIVLIPKDFKQIKVKFENGKVRHFGPQHILEKIERLSSDND